MGIKVFLDFMNISCYKYNVNFMMIDYVWLNNIFFSVIIKICKDMNLLDWGCVRFSLCYL